MLQRLLTAGARRACVLAVCTLGLHCGDPSSVERIGVSHQAIVGGALVDAPSSPVLYITSPEGNCTAVLVAATLAITARHCVASLNDTGTFACTASGELLAGTAAGQLGPDNAPSSVSVFSSESVAQGRAFGDSPDAVATMILSTQAPTVCMDDLAFLVLSRPIPGLIPASVRLGPTEDGEPVDVWGYGLTQTAGDPLALRVSQGAEIVGIGLAVASTLTQEAPVRAVRVGPGTTTCNGDSGGPILSKDGAVIGIVSLGLQAGAVGPYCASGNYPATTGPRLADYATLALQAFAAAGASLGPEDAGSARRESGPSPVSDAGAKRVTNGDEPEPSGPAAAGASCAVRPFRPGSQVDFDGVTLVLALAAIAIRRRSR